MLRRLELADMNMAASSSRLNIAAPYFAAAL